MVAHSTNTINTIFSTPNTIYSASGSDSTDATATAAATHRPPPLLLVLAAGGWLPPPATATLYFPVEFARERYISTRTHFGHLSAASRHEAWKTVLQSTHSVIP